ncbi:MAG: hypothetical protein NZ891_01750 [bacterium]|nr:hypothetical protein [bacterium]MDW8163452.1 hypothetical protein [Candidatus Omnitrophota bacterium]
MDTSDIIVQSSTINAGDYIDMNATNNVLIDSSYLTSGNDTSITADNGYIRVCYSTIEAENVEMTAGTNIIICSSSQVLANDSAYFEAGENIEVGYVSAGNYVEMVAGGAIIDNNGAGMNIVTTDLVMLAGEGIGEKGDPIETTISNLQAGTLTGDIYIANTGDLNLVDIQGLGFALGAADGNIDVSTTEDLTISGLVAATGSVYLYALDGDIIDNLVNDATTPYDIIAGSTSGLYAGGLIGVKPGETTWFDPIEVEINGDLYVYAGEMYNFVSVAIDGIVSPRDMLMVNDDWGVPPGLIIFNGRVNGGEEIDRWYRGVGNAIHYIGIEKYIYETLMLYIIDPSFFEPAPSYWDLREYKKAIEGLVLK